ncbi:MAG: hypothetical protein JRG76_12160 [Deltaproteobacteria bacterium]|nr:hypothetical protein [Deltaproteobacteria bacterium]MBW2415251.1 hypothetical protein [Deltaproteobacteria bacterium]
MRVPTHLLAVLAGLACMAPRPVMSASFDCTPVTEVPKAECDALVSIHGAFGGAGWTDSSGWLETITPASWFGVTASAGHVTGLGLSSNNLAGTVFPAEIGDLASLGSLDLSGNPFLTGVLPDEILGLSLHTLYLDGTGLTIPSTQAFETWLSGIENVRLPGSPVPDPPIHGLLLLASLALAWRCRPRGVCGPGFRSARRCGRPEAGRWAGGR